MLEPPDAMAMAAVPARRMLIMIRFRALAGLSLSVLASACIAAEATSRIEIPITQTRLSDGNIRYSVPVRVEGGGTIPAMLDTGSVGLRIMARALAAAQYEETGVTRQYRFGTGIVLSGPLVRAVVAVGAASTAGPITMQIVQSVGCAQGRPDCPAARLDPSDYGIGGDGLPREGFDAILGLSMYKAPISPVAANPLGAIGDRKWIVELPLPDASGPGRLIVNPGRAERAGFRAIAPGAAGSKDGQAGAGNRLSLCLDGKAPKDRCAPVKLDTGDRDGLQPFYAYAILFDQHRGAVAVKSRRAE